MLKRSITLLSLTLIAACGGTVDDLLTVELGAGDIQPVTIDRTWQIGADRVSTCPVGEVTVDTADGGTATVVFAPSDAGCRFTLEQEDLVLFDEQQVRSASNDLQDNEIDAVESASVRIDEFQVTDAGASPLDLGSNFADLELALDGAVIATLSDLEQAQSQPVTKQLPSSVLDSIKEGVRMEQEVTADLTVTLDVQESALTDFPDAVRLDTTVQPIVTVDVIDAAL
jgi:hypothetical protein